MAGTRRKCILLPVTHARLRSIVLTALVAAALALGAAPLSGCALSGRGGGTASTEGQGAGTSSTAGTAPSSTTTSAPSTTTTLSREQAVRQVVESMTLQDKTAQVLLVPPDAATFTTLTQQAIATAAPAGFVLLGRNVESKAQLTALSAALQTAAASAGAPGFFIAADEEGGPVVRVKEGVPVLPSAREMAAASTAAQVKALAGRTAAALLAQGVNMALAPVADVVADEDSFLYDRSYSADPGTVSRFVVAVVKGFQSEGMIAVVKHFPGHGSAPENTHTQAPVSDAGLEDFDRVHLPPFVAAVGVGTDGVMVGHFVVPAFDPAHAASQSAKIIDGVLRGDLGFKGLVVSDDMEMAAAAGRAGAVGSATPAELGRAAVGALAAGCDLLIVTGTSERQAAVRDAISAAVRSGVLDADRLDDAVTRILMLKIEHGIPVPGVPDTGGSAQ